MIHSSIDHCTRQVVVCDEPTACLDPFTRREVWKLLRMEKAGRCILMSTHFMEAAEFLADRIAIMRDGELFTYGTAESIINSLGPGYRLVSPTCIPSQCSSARIHGHSYRSA